MALMEGSGDHLTSVPSTEGGDDEPWSLVSDETFERPQEGLAHEQASGASWNAPVDALPRPQTPFLDRKSCDGDDTSSQEQLLAPNEDRDDARSEGSEVLSSWKSTDQLGQDIRRAVSARPKVPAQRTERYLKILVVGDMSSGRTTAMKTLFAAADAQQHSAFKDVPRADSLQVFNNDPVDMCTELVMDGADANCCVHYSIQETPGLHHAGAGATVLHYIEDQLEQWLVHELDPDRKTPLALMRDPRVDVCLFFIPPDALKPQDVKLMQRLSAMVPVIPVLAKADAMTDEEREVFRAHVTQELAAASVDCGHNVMYQFSQAELAAAGVEAHLPPFAVMGSTTPDLSVGSRWPVREYGWGRAPVLASATSDVLKLRDLLLVEGLEGFKRKTEAHYHLYRHERMDPRSCRRQSQGARCDSPQRTESAVIRTGTRARRSPAAKGLVGWTKIALVGLLMLSTGGCLLFWNKNAQLRNSLDAQIKDNRLREQVIAQLMECIIDE